MYMNWKPEYCLNANSYLTGLQIQYNPEGGKTACFVLETNKII